MTSTSPEASQPLLAVVLLDSPLAGIGELLTAAHPSLAQTVQAQPAIGALPVISVPVNGFDVRFAVQPSETSAEFRQAVAESLVRQRVEPVAATHGGTALVATTVAAGADPIAAHQIISNFAAGILDRDDARAVWLPHQGQVTTDVLFVGELSRRPAHTWFRVVAMQLDPAAGTSHAFTDGLGALGATDVQWSGSRLSPQEAWNVLRTAVADLLEAGTPPAPGTRIDLDGVPHTLVPGTDLLRSTPVLDVVASQTSGQGQAQDERQAPSPTKRRWFGRG